MLAGHSTGVRFILRQLKQRAVHVTDIGNAPVEDTVSRLRVNGLDPARLQVLELTLNIVIAERQEKEALAVVREMPTRYRFGIARTDEHEPAIANACSCNLGTACRMVNYFKWIDPKHSLVAVNRLLEVANDKIDVMDAIG